MELTDLELDAQTTPKSTYRWEVPGKSTAVEFDFDVIDRLGAEVARGYGAVPRRGLEVGGILLGNVEEGDKTVLHVVDFEPVPFRHSNGPSYQFSEEDDRVRFEQALDRWKPVSGGKLHTLGFFRGHTREGMSLSPEDLSLFDEYFRNECQIVLLVKPFATRVPMAGLFFRENGELHGESSYKEFPFRRRELGGGSNEHQPMPEAAHGESENTEPAPMATEEVLGLDTSTSRTEAPVGTIDDDMDSNRGTSPPVRSFRLRGGWVWLPLSFIFLLLGTVLGFQIALSVGTKNAAATAGDPYALNLSATPSADSVHVRWNRNAEAIRTAQRGMLIITENGKEKNVSLDAGHLRNGSVIYRRVSDSIQFRLEVFPKQKVSVSETVEFEPVRTEESGAGS